MKGGGRGRGAGQGGGAGPYSHSGAKVVEAAVEAGHMQSPPVFSLQRQPITAQPVESQAQQKSVQVCECVSAAPVCLVGIDIHFRPSCPCTRSMAPTRLIHKGGPPAARWSCDKHTHTERNTIRVNITTKSAAVYVCVARSLHD